MQFLAVYVREAHPSDDWRMTANDRVGIVVRQPRDLRERVEVARTCCGVLDISMPLVVDDLDDRVGHAYSGMPDRLYIIDATGRVAYKGGRGPFGFKPGEMEQSLILLLLDQEVIPVAPSKAGRSQGRVPLLSDDETWRRLPPLEQGEAGQPLPAWARALAGPLPRTTAAMLELDYLHRARSPLDPKLRGQLRWVAADANRCAYARAYAEADLRRAGVPAAEIAALAGDRAGRPEAERAALAFARKLTLAAYTVTDEEVARLIALYGEKQVVAMVLLLAYANFQDRLLLALDLPVEEGGPLPPLAVRFRRDPEVPAQPRTKPADPPAAGQLARIDLTEWRELDFDALQKAMEQQRRRQPRIRVPTWEEFRTTAPPGYPADRPLRIKWSLVCAGYQPELAGGWLTCLRTFGQEARQDRVFEECLFWVVTRSLQCFY